MAESGPQQFGKYLLLSKIAAGGMAVTYRARMTGAAGVTKPCVIKQILPHFVDDPDFVEMFIGEARLVAGMSHSNIAQVFDFGEVDGQYFIAMELVQGQPLSKVLRRAAKAGMGFFPEPLALHIVSKLCDGLDYAHRHVGEDGQELGLVHRDVSPDNVLISYEGEIKVIDFGIAKATAAVEAKTSPGTLKGKYPYFSPEQAQGRLDLDARTDVYAAGVILYEMVCGRRPFEGEFVTVLPRILEADFLPPSAVNAGVSVDLENTIFGAMAVDRESRYQTAKDLSGALVELLYRDNSRFTPALLSQLMAYLFGEELAAEGRKAEVPITFKDQLAAWQTGAIENSQARARTPSSSGSSSRPSSPGIRPSSPGVRPSSPGVRPSSPGVRPGSDGGGKPGTDGGRRPTTSNPGVRRVTSAGGQRRVTNPNMPRQETSTARGRALGAERPGPPIPELPDEPDTDSSMAAPPTAVPTLAAPHDTPVETPAVTDLAPKTTAMAAPNAPRMSTGPRTTVDEIREKLAREQAERDAKRSQQVKSIALSMFGIALVVLTGALFYHYVIKQEPLPEEGAYITTLWVTSRPAGAAVKLNNRELSGVTPLMVEGVLVGQANTLVLTKPGFLPWTRRFTPTSRTAEPVEAELQIAAASTPVVLQQADAVRDAGPATTDAGASAVAAAGEVTDAGLPVTAEGTKPQEDAKGDGGTGDDMHVVDYPTRLLVLRPMFNAMPVTQYPTASIDLNPAVAYSVWTEGSASLADGKGTASNSLVWWAEGDNIPADDSFGLLGGGQRTVKGAKRLHVFALDDNGPEDNRGTVRIVLRQSAYVPPRSFTFDAQQNAFELKPEHQVVMRGLNPRSTYLLTVRDDQAELRSGTPGHVKQVLCVEKDSTPTSVRGSHRILETGKRYQVSGVEALACTFPDAKLTDNQGAIEVDVVDVTDMNRKQRNEALRGAKRSER